MTKHQPGISKGALYGLVTVYVSILGLVVSGLLYMNHVNRTNDQRWCSVLRSIDDAYDQARNSPNTSPAGRHIAEEFHKLRIQFGC